MTTELEEGLAFLEGATDEDLQHFGVKGMKWGVRHDRRRGRVAPDLSSIDDDELKRIVSRMELERRYRNALPSREVSAGHKFLAQSANSFLKAGVNKGSQEIWEQIFKAAKKKGGSGG